MTERQHDGVKRQPFRFVDGEDANAIPCRTGHGTFAELLVPSREEGLNVGSSGAAKVVLQLVEEGQRIDIFVLYIAKRKDAPQPFCKQIEWQLQQVVFAFREFLWQDVIDLFSGNIMDGRLFLSEHISKIMEHQVFLGNLVCVLLVDKQSQGCHNHLNAG